jgi:hypothetical protein
MKAVQVVRCRGDPHVRSRHPGTFAVTTDNHLTPAGDCIIGICADTGAAGLSSAFKQIIATEGSHLITRLTCRDICVLVHAQGGTGLLLDHPGDLVWRKSTFMCGRTIGIRSDHAACDLPPELVSLLRQGELLEVELTAVSPDCDANGSPHLPPGAVMTLQVE